MKWIVSRKRISNFWTEVQFRQTHPRRHRRPGKLNFEARISMVQMENSVVSTNSTLRPRRMTRQPFYRICSTGGRRPYPTPRHWVRSCPVWLSQTWISWAKTGFRMWCHLHRPVSQRVSDRRKHRIIRTTNSNLLTRVTWIELFLYDLTSYFACFFSLSISFSHCNIILRIIIIFFLFIICNNVYEFLTVSSPFYPLWFLFFVLFVSMLMYVILYRFARSQNVSYIKIILPNFCFFKRFFSEKVMIATLHEFNNLKYAMRMIRNKVIVFSSLC